MDFEVKYMSGAGNLFSVIKFNQHIKNINFSKIAKLLCNLNEFNKFKTEGLIVIKPSSSNNTDFEAMFFNPDGSTGMMCGNGGRCAVRFAIDSGINPTYYKFSLSNIIYNYEISESNIKLYFPPPTQFTPNIDIIVNDNIAYLGDYVNVGTLHFIINYDDFNDEIGESFEDFDINKFAIPIRNHIEFSPIGVNVNFYKIKDNIVYLRTFEKGVEAETGACGTGAISTALSLLWKKELQTPITISPTSKENLKVDFEFEDLKLKNIILEGPATFINQATIKISDNILL